MSSFVSTPFICVTTLSHIRIRQSWITVKQRRLKNEQMNAHDNIMITVCVCVCVCVCVAVC